MPPLDESDMPFLFRFLNLEKGTEFRVVDFSELNARSAPADATGRAIALFDPVPSNYWYEIERMVVVTNSAAISAANVYIGDTDNTANLRDGTASGNKAISDNRSVLRVPPNGVLSVVWTGMDVGAVGRTWIQFRKVTKV